MKPGLQGAFQGGRKGGLKGGSRVRLEWVLTWYLDRVESELLTVWQPLESRRMENDTPIVSVGL